MPLVSGVIFLCLGTMILFDLHALLLVDIWLDLTRIPMNARYPIADPLKSQ